MSEKKLKSTTASETGTRLISKSETDRSPKIGDNQTGDLMEQPDISSRFVCDICGRSFDNEKSLKMHKLRAHRVSPHRPKRGEGGRATRLPRYEERKGRISTEADQLRKILSAVGYGKIDACIELCDAYGYDVVSVYRALRELGAGLSVIRPTLSWWSAKRNEPIPEEIAEELGMDTMFQRYSVRRHDYGYRRPRYEGELSHGSVADVVNAIGNLIQSLNQPQTPPSTSNDMITALQSQITTLQEELRTLRSQLEEERRRALQNELEQLRKKVEELEKRPSDVESKKLDILDKRLGDIAEMLKTVINSSVVPVQPPKREESAESSKVQLPPELLWEGE